MYKNSNPLRTLAELGQSVYLDYIRRDLMTSGELRSMIEDDSLAGMTSNPAIFENAIVESNIYDDDISSIKSEGKNAADIYEALSQKDVCMAADEFRKVYDKTNGRDGYVSLEVNPHLAHDTEGTIEEARRLWKTLNRPNIFIKVPATAQGIPAIKQLISDGININVTLLFGLPRYREVAEAYIAGLEERAAKGLPIDKINSVASFFVSRIDLLVDSMLEGIIESGGEKSELAGRLQGKVAVASAVSAFTIYQNIFTSEHFKNLEKKGANVQRLLWASTGTKNPEYSDVKYVDSLVTAHTVNTIPTATLNAYRDHGDPRPRVEEQISEAREIMDSLPKLGIDINKVSQQLEDEGVEKFNTPFDKLLQAIENA